MAAEAALPVPRRLHVSRRAVLQSFASDAVAANQGGRRRTRIFRALPIGALGRWWVRGRFGGHRTLGIFNAQYTRNGWRFRSRERWRAAATTRRTWTTKI